jgi:hypothetical protein
MAIILVLYLWVCLSITVLYSCIALSIVFFEYRQNGHFDIKAGLKSYFIALRDSYLEIACILAVGFTILALVLGWAKFSYFLSIPLMELQF